MLIHTHHTEVPCIELTLFAILWVVCGIHPPFLLPQATSSSCSGLSLIQNKASGLLEPQKGAKSLFTILTTFFFIFNGQ